MDSQPAKCVVDYRRIAEGRWIADDERPVAALTMTCQTPSRLAEVRRDDSRDCTRLRLPAEPSQAHRRLELVCPRWFEGARLDAISA